MSFIGKHLLSVDSFSLETLQRFFAIVQEMEPIARRKKICRVLEGAVLGNLFFEASTRTRMSFHAAFARLGGSVCDSLDAACLSIAKGESLSDTSQVVSGYFDALVIRHPHIGAAKHFAKKIHIPVINAGDGSGEHPSQALLDVYTILKEFKQLNQTIKQKHIALVGDLKYSRTIHSFIKLLTLYPNLKFTLLAPPQLELPQTLADLIHNRGHQIYCVDSFQKIADYDLDIVYLTRLQKERRSEKHLSLNFKEEIKRLKIDRTILQTKCKQHALIMHPLPRDTRIGSDDFLNTDLDNDPRVIFFRQADNGIPVRMALFTVLMGIDVHQIKKQLRPITWQPPHKIRD